MPRLIVKLGDREVQECAIGPRPLSIGRLPDNHLVIDNPAVSGRHARVYLDGHHCVLEDLKSTNGTFVNDQPVARHTLLEGDVVLIGKHTLVFTRNGGEPDAAAAPAGGTKTLDPPAPASSPIYDAVVPKTAIPTAQGRIGTVKVIAGHTGQSEYVLAAVTTMIGKADNAQIRVTGWFTPKIAAAIARKGDGFTITPIGGRLAVNGERVSGRRELASGDRIEVSGLTLEFTLS